MEMFISQELGSIYVLNQDGGLMSRPLSSNDDIFDTDYGDFYDVEMEKFDEFEKESVEEIKKSLQKLRNAKAY